MVPTARVARACAAAIFVLQFAVLDLLSSARSLSLGERALVTIASAGVGALVLAIRPRTARVAAAVLFGLTFVTQATFARYWHVFVDRQIAESALHNLADVRSVLASMPGRAAALVAAGLAAEITLVLAAPVLRPSRAVIGAAAATLVGLTFGPAARRATPEIALADATLHLASARLDHAAKETGPRVARDETPVATTGPKLPNVVFILTESVRASDACSAPSDTATPCETMREVDALTRDRLPLREMRAVSSYTAVSLSAVLTGRTQTADRESTLAAPTVFDFVRRVRGPDGARPHVAVWTAQMASVFERDDVQKAADSFISVETLLGRAIDDDDKVTDEGVDRKLAERALRDLDALPQPFFLFLQFAGTHAPYYVDPARAPFAPWSRVVSWSTLGELHAAYKNAIVAQDAALAEVLRAVFRKSEASGTPLVITYTSDHGEAFGEHSAIHHGQNLYDEQIHVPGWMLTRGGGVDDRGLRALRDYERALVTHLDLLPTVLDVYGVRGAFGLRTEVAALPGRSLLGSPTPIAPIPITNCTALFPCPLNAWGMLGEQRVLTAQVWDPEWRCVDLASHGADGCDALRALSQAHFKTLPSGAPNR